MKIHQAQRKQQYGVHKWLVLLSAYISIALNVGVNPATGSLFLAIMEEFQATRSQVAVMQSTMYGVFLVSGIVTGPLIKRYGARNAGFCGAVCSSLGIMASYFASSIIFLIISLGVFGEFGFSLVYISASTATEQQFEGNRKLTMLSIIASGVGVGGMIYPYLLAYLHDIYGVQGTLLLVGILCAHNIPSSLLWSNVEASASNNGSVSGREKNNESGYTSKDNNEAGVTIHGTNVGDNAVVRDVCSHGTFNGMHEREKCNHYSYLDIDVPMKVVSMDKYAKLGQTVRVSELRSDRSGIGVGSHTINVVNNAVSKEDITKRLTASESVVHLITNKPFVLFMIALAISYPIFTVPLIFIADIFIDKGFAETDTTLALLLINVLSIFGRMSVGFIVKIPKFPTISLPIITSLVTALAIVGVMLVENLGANIACLALIGFGIGITVAMLTVVPVRLVERDNLPTAMGLLFASSGLGTATFGPVVGLLRDRTNSYNVPLYCAVGCLILAAGIYTVAHITRRQARVEFERERRYSVFYVTKF